MSKKIYYIAHCRFPSERAHAIQIAKMTEAMRLNGIDVELILPRRTNPIKETAEKYYGLKTALKSHYLPVLDLYNFGRFGYLISGLSFILSYYFFISKKRKQGERFSLYTIDMDQFSLVGVSFLKTPFIVEVHDAKKYSWVFSRVFKNAERILTINEINKKEIIENFRLSPEKILVQSNGIDLEMFSQTVDRVAWREKWQIPNDKSLVLYVGKCYDWKGLEIFDEALRKMPTVNFGFVGCTKEEVAKATGRKYDFSNALFFGQRPYQEMVKWMKSADILLVIGTKKNEYSYLHTSPMKLFEYLPTGVPILAAGTSAIKSAVTDKEVFFYEPDNAESFISRIREILTNKDLAKKISNQAKLIAPKFSWQNRAKSILPYIQKSTHF